MSGFGTKAYAKLGVATDVLNADPHRLILILFDGALACMHRAKGYLAERRIAEKCQAISQACEIVDRGLRVSVDPSHDPAFAGRLVSLYQFVTMRLLQANLRNDARALDEATSILQGLRDAWVQIGPAPMPAIDAVGAPRGAPTSGAALAAYRA